MRKFLALFFALSCAFLLADQDFRLIEERAKTAILTPCLSQRETAKIQLSNGLEVYLISDPKTDESGAALCVKVGSWDEPEEHPGMAHFTEHLLFLGTKKYPKEADYHRFVTENGGVTNAYTAPDSTNYLFAIQNDAFVGGLDRFSQFFKEPLFNPSGVARELQAIDQEYAKNIENDYFRQHYIHKELANQNHPFRQFSIGNSQTLSSISQETLKNWYKNNYSAHLMRLVVLSHLPMEELKPLVAENFSGIPVAHKTPYNDEIPALNSDYNGHMVYIEPVKNMRSLFLIWELPPKFANMKNSKPERTICSLLGHEGEESLLAQLKREKLAESLSCGEMSLGANNTLFLIEIGLTQNGLGDVDTVIERCFQTINLLKKTAIPSYIFEEIQRISTIHYQYQPSEDVFAQMMHHSRMLSGEESLTTYPEQTLILQENDPKAVQELLHYLTPHNARFEVLTPLASLDISPEKREKWIGTSYTLRAIPEKKLVAWAHSKPHPDIAIAAQNPFIPENLTVLETEKSSQKGIMPEPKTVVDSDHAKIYFAQDDRFKVPKVNWSFEIKTPQIQNGEATKVVMGDLYVKHLQEELNRLSYPATLVDLKYSIKRTPNGILISINGYSDKANSLFEEVLKRIQLEPLTEDKFKIYKEILQRKYQNFFKESPIRQASESLKDAINKSYTTEKEKTSAIKKISVKKYNTFLTHLFDETFVEGSLYGNLTKAQAKQLAEKLLNTLHSEPYPKERQYKHEVVNLPKDKGPFFIETPSKSQGNAVLLVVEGEDFSFKERAAQQILMKGMHEPFFSTLRTKQQTGYLVQCHDQETEKHLFNVFAVQSNTHDVRDLLARFELFIEGYMQELTKSELTEERFQTIRSAVLTSLEQPPKNTEEMGSLLQHIAFNYNGDFDWFDQRIQGVKDLSYGEFVEFSEKFMGRQNKKRLAVLLKGSLPEKNVFNYSKLKGSSELRHMCRYSCADDVE